MQSTWAGFAKDPTKGPGWPAVGVPGGLDVAVIGSADMGNPNGAVTVMSGDIDKKCKILEEARGIRGMMDNMQSAGGVIGRAPVLSG
jgi:hypothetical protein